MCLSFANALDNDPLWFLATAKEGIELVDDVWLTVFLCTQNLFWHCPLGSLLYCLPFVLLMPDQALLLRLARALNGSNLGVILLHLTKRKTVEVIYFLIVGAVWLKVLKGSQWGKTVIDVEEKWHFYFRTSIKIYTKPIENLL